MCVELADSPFVVGVVGFCVSLLRAVDGGGDVMEQFMFGTAREIVCLNRCIRGAA